MPQVIGEIEKVDLRIKAGNALIFDVEFTDSEGAVIPITDARSKVRRGWEGDVVLDLDPHMTVVSDVVLVDVPGSVTTELDPMSYGEGRWDFEVSTADGDMVTLWEGNVRIDPEATR